MFINIFFVSILLSFNDVQSSHLNFLFWKWKGLFINQLSEFSTRCSFRWNHLFKIYLKITINQFESTIIFGIRKRCANKSFDKSQTLLLYTFLTTIFFMETESLFRYRFILRTSLFSSKSIRNKFRGNSNVLRRCIGMTEATIHE